MSKNHQNCHIWNFQFWHFLPVFVLSKLTCLVTLFDCKLQFIKNSPKLSIFGIFNEFLSTQNVNAARFARNIECDFFVIFNHCAYVSSLKAVCLLPNHCIIASQLSKLWNGRSVNFSLSFVLTIMSWKWIWFSYYFSAWFYPQKFWHSV